MAKEVLFLVEEAAEGGYTARALGHSVFTEADTWDELREAVRDAVRCHFDPDEQTDFAGDPVREIGPTCQLIHPSGTRPRSEEMASGAQIYRLRTD